MEIETRIYQVIKCTSEEADQISEMPEGAELLGHTFIRWHQGWDGNEDWVVLRKDWRDYAFELEVERKGGTF